MNAKEKLRTIQRQITRLRVAYHLTDEEKNGVLWNIEQDIDQLLEELNQPEEALDDLPF